MKSAKKVEDSKKKSNFFSKIVEFFKKDKSIKKKIVSDRILNKRFSNLMTRLEMFLLNIKRTNHVTSLTFRTLAIELLYGQSTEREQMAIRKYVKLKWLVDEPSEETPNYIG